MLSNFSSAIQIKSGGRDILAETGSEVSSAEIIERLDGWKTAKIFVEDQSGAFEKWLGQAMSVPTSFVQFRYGTKRGDTPEYVPWETWIITGYRAVLKTVMVELADMLYLFTGQVKVMARKGRISEIVKAIVSEVSTDYGIRFETEIEDTIDSSFLFYQTGDTDFRFVVKRLCPRAINSEGGSSYKFWCRAGKVCFAPLDYAIPKVQVSSFHIVDKMKDNTMHIQARNGAAGVRTFVYDPKTTQTDIVQSLPGSALKRADVTPSFSSDWVLRKARVVGPNGFGEAYALNQYDFESAHEKLYQASFFHQDHIQIRAGDPILATLNNEGEPTTIWNGLWSVGEIVHSIERGRIDTVFKVFRGEQHRVSRQDSEAPGRGFRNTDKSSVTSGLKLVQRPD